MNVIKALVFILIQGMVNVIVIAAEEDSTSSRSSYLKMWENQRLEGHVVEHFESPSLISCSRSCLRNPWCSSTNFKMPSDKDGKGSCELNKHGAIDGNTEFHEQQGVTFSMMLKGCLMTGCLNDGSCGPDEKKQTFSCSCKVPWAGEKCELIEANASSCDEAQIKANQTLLNGKYLLTNRSMSFKVYCHMTDNGRGWTLIARFSNSDEKNWMDDTGYWWYDKQVAMGTTTDPSVNSDMISPAFWFVSGREFKITRSDDPTHTPLLQTTDDCLAGQTFRSKITSYGNFTNEQVWSRDRCLGNCTVQYGGQYKSTDGFQQAKCSGKLQSANNIGFWCHWLLDGSVMMIGRGGGNCTRADHGIGITETNAASFGPEKDPKRKNQGEYDFGHNAYTFSTPTKSYSLNLWIR